MAEVIVTVQFNSCFFTSQRTNETNTYTKQGKMYHLDRNTSVSGKKPTVLRPEDVYMHTNIT
jgi:hypothetical protein